ncbi:glycosyl transferase, group 2 family protein [hydrocarbon metagenome]|uniref:Glycosyl transferase, group 2 family protein n=1 Tax=hydrocarbon metagenome TaxID=938273 RepID=A0A0W8G7A6_9ZZZZ
MAQSAENEKLAGIAGEMFALSLDEACLYYKNYLNNFQVDLPLAVNFISRVTGESAATRSPVVRPLLEQAIKAAVNIAPLDPDILQIGLNAGVAQGAEVVLKIVQATHAEHDTFREIRKAPFKQFHADLRRACIAVLAKHPMAVRFADMLLSLDLFTGSPPCEALARFNCPKALRLIWDKRLFDHAATLGDDEAAWPLWEKLKSQINEPIALSRAAEMHRRAGRTDEAVGLYERAFALDPLQRPYALRAEALRRPFVPDAGLLASKKVCIYLYSYNKATILGETLESLAATDIGPARIKVLLNGCTDDSAAVVAKARTLFPDNDFEIIALPVNIGAPAARNWLLSQPATRESDYVAFLDDDIYLQPDWLSHLLTVAESDPTIGNVGCKVVFPGRFPLLQYLYRHISFCTEEAIRASIPVPYMQYDIGLYDVIRETRVVMGCQHLLRVDSLRDAPWFDIRYSPSQIDDTDHDLQLCLSGWKVMYCGTVTCVHRQNSGTSMRSKLDIPAQGSIMGNDVKFHYKWLERMDEMRRLDSISLNA